jgi:hypothetical protein
MSILNKDSELIRDGRTQPLKDVEAPLRDQVVDKLVNKLDELEIGQKVKDIWSQGNSNRTAWLERQRNHLQDWDEFLESSAEGPFAGSSSLHIPMPLIVAKTLHARFLQALLGIDPPFVVKPRTEASVPRAELVQDLMNYCLRDWCNKYKGIDETVDLWIWGWITTGSGVMKARWDVEYERFVDVRPVQKPAAPRFEIDEQGNEITIPQFRVVEEEVPVSEKCFEGPCFEFVHHEDLLIIGGQGDPQVADSVHHRTRPTASELLTLVDRKVFREDETLEAIESGADNEAGGIGTDIKQQRALNAGKGTIDSASDLDRYEIIESYLKVDVDGSGINSNVVVWTHLKTGKILRATYLRRINKAGTRPFFKIDFHKRPGQDYGVGIIEMIAPLTKELDAIHNLKLDYGILSTMPFGFYRPTSSIDPKTIELKPGMLIPVDDPAAISFPNIGNRTSFGFQEEASLMSFIERLTTVNDFTLGAMSGTQGATRTATGVRGLMGESNANLDVYLRRLNQGWKAMLQYLFNLLQQRLPPGLEFRVTGDAGNDYFRTVKSSAELSGMFDFEVSPNSANSNKTIQQEVAAVLYQSTASPLDVQLGIITPFERYNAVKNYFKTMGVKDFGQYVRKPEGMEYLPTPEEITNRVLRGVPVPVTPDLDHQGFLAYFEQIFNDDQLLGQFSEEQALALAAQAKKHEGMVQALQQMQAQQANVAQMRTNAQAGTQVSPFQTLPGAVIAQPELPVA